MTKNVTMAINEDLLKKARKIAIEKNTTLTALIRKHLESLVEQEEQNRARIVSELVELIDHSNAVIGRKTWNREDLHER
jgi:hypothetical protein